MSPDPQGSNPPDSDPPSPGRRLFGYMLAAILVFAITAGLYLALTADTGSNEATGASHIATASGSSNGLIPDLRSGTKVVLGTIPPLAQAAKAAQCKLMLDLPNEGQKHLNPDDPVPAYKTNPPTSGDHITPPLMQADGAYIDPAQSVNVVHSLEHGRISVQYDPSLPRADQLELKGLYDDNYSAALLYPNPDMPYAVAATAWQNMIGCPEYMGEKTLVAIKAFGAEYLGKGPEPSDLFTPLTGPKFSDQ